MDKKDTSEENSQTKPIEKMLNMSPLEQYVNTVCNFSTKYNFSNSYSYAPTNLLGPYVKYPSYGDFPEAFFLRSYGKWWKQSKATQKNYAPQDFDPLGAEDFVTVMFEQAVIPRDVCIYEVYNPGAIVRIWGKLHSTELQWNLVWEGPPQVCPHKSRKFHPKIKIINKLVNMIRLEFNQSHLEYHTAIEAILLGGFQPSGLKYSMIQAGLIDKVRIESAEDKKIVTVIQEGKDYFSVLPYEVILHIIQNLDLKSISQCAQVNRRWNQVCSDPVLYQNICLKPYWHLIDCEALEYFIRKSKNVRKLDVSWCGNNIYGFFSRFAMLISENHLVLTHLSLNNCYWVNNELMEEISKCQHLVDLRLANTFSWSQSSLYNLNKLISLDLSYTNIQEDDLVMILKANPRLKHIVLDLCENLSNMDMVAEALATHNRNLVTWSSWKTTSFSARGIRYFGYLPDLEELDLGWCLMADAGDCLEYIAAKCKKLRRLILSEWRGISDAQLLPVIMSCKELTQLDFMGIKTISEELCEKALLLLPKLRLLEISFCDSIRQDEVEIWRQQYPHITIQRSCQYIFNDYIN